MIYFFQHKYFSSEISSFEDILIDNEDDVNAARSAIRKLIGEKLRSSESRTSKVQYYDARIESCKFQKIQEIIEKEEKSLNVMKTQKMMEINNLSSLKEMSSASLHRLTNRPLTSININNPVGIQKLLEHLIDPSIRDISPYGKEEAQSSLHLKNESFNYGGNIALGPNGVPILASNPSMLTPSLVPVHPSMMIPTGVNIEQVPMDISDGESEKKHRRSGSRTYSPSHRSRRRTPYFCVLLNMKVILKISDLHIEEDVIRDPGHLLDLIQGRNLSKKRVVGEILIILRNPAMMIGRKIVVEDIRVRIMVDP